MTALDLSAHLIALYLLAATLLGRRAYQRLLRDLEQGAPAARQRYLRRGIARKSALLAVVAAWLALTSQRYPFAFAWATPAETALWSSYAVALGVGSVFYYRRRGDGQLRLLQRLAGGLLPQAPVEARLFGAFAVLSGVGEEVIFRWFLMSYFAGYWYTGLWGALIASSVVFGIAHLYQGRLGVLISTAIGGVFGLCGSPPERSSCRCSFTPSSTSASC